MIKEDMKDHWEGIYSRTSPIELGWYQPVATPSLNLIKKCGLDFNDSIIDIGSGTSILIDNLLGLGYTNLIANDISKTALELSKKRLGRSSHQVKWIVDDITMPSELNKLTNIALWHDRAVFHFLTEESDRKKYVDLLNKAIGPRGHIILATFNMSSFSKCSGLEVRLNNSSTLAEILGKRFELIEWFDYQFTMPNGDSRPYVYTLFRKIN